MVAAGVLGATKEVGRAGAIDSTGLRFGKCIVVLINIKGGTMQDKQDLVPDEKSAETPLSKSVSRRDFLKMAGIAGAAVGLGAGLGGLVAACGEETTTTSASETTITGATSTSEGESTTSVSTSAEAGRKIKCGFVAPLTGAIAQFGLPDQFCHAMWTDAVKDGLVCGDGLKHPIEIIMKDSQSDSNRAAQVAGDLITNDAVDIIMSASTNDTVTPVAAQAETLGCPMMSNDAPWQAFYYSRNPPEEGFHWTYHMFWGLEDVIATFMDLWSQVPTNKIVTGFWPNDADGNSWRDPEMGFPAVIPSEGYKLIWDGGFNSGTEDYSAPIAQAKKEGAEIMTGVPLPPDWTNIWKQCSQQGYQPKIATIGKACLFPQAMEALGELGYGISTEVWWTPRHPFKSSLTGETCQQVADNFTTRTGLQWTQPLLHYGVFEVVVDALKRCKDVDDKEQVVAAIASTKMETLAGPVDFTSPVDINSLHPVKNVYRTPLVGGQWVKGEKWPYDLKICSNKQGPMINVDGKLEPIKYA